MGSQELYTTAWSYDAVDQGGLESFVVPLPTNLSGVEASSSPSTSSSYDGNNDASTSSTVASHTKLYALPDRRHILLRVLEPGNSLQLQDINSGINITFQLPGAARRGKIVPECSLSVDDNSTMQLIFLADLGVGLIAYRLLLSEDDLHNPANLPIDGRDSAGWCTEQQILPSHVISKSSPVLVHALDKSHLSHDALALAFSDGTLLKLEWIQAEGRFHETALSRQHSFLSSVRSLLPGRFGSSPNLAATAAAASPTRTSSFESSAEQIVSIASLSSTCLYTISRDRKLRIWSVISNTCLETLQLPQNPTTMEIVPSATPNGENAHDSSNSSLLPEFPMPLMRLFPGGSEHHAATQYLLVHIPTHQVQTSFFILYSLQFDDKGRLLSVSPVLEKPCDFAVDSPSSSSYLADFQIIQDADQERTLWTLWNEAGQSIVRFSRLDMSSSGDILALADPNSTIVSVSPPLGESWLTVKISPHQLNHSLDIPSATFDRNWAALRSDIDPSNTSTPELAHQITLCAKEACLESFLEHLFHPGRYPTTALNAAFYSYIKSLTHQASHGRSNMRIPSRPEGASSLAQQILDVVGSHLVLQEDPATGAMKEEDFVKAYKLEHMKFLALAEDNKRNAKIPLSFGLTSTDDILILAKGAIASPVEVSWPLAITQGGQSDIPVPFDPALSSSVAELYNLALKTTTDLRNLSSACFAAFEEAAVQAVTNPTTVSIEDTAADIFQEDLDALVDEDLQLHFSAQMKQAVVSWQQIAGSSDQASSVGGLAGLLLLAINSLSAASNEEQEMNDDAHAALFARGSLTGLVVDNATVDILERYEQALAMFLIVLFVQNGVSEPPSSNGSSDEEEGSSLSDEDFMEVLARSWEVLKGFALAKWLGKQNIAMTDLNLELADDEEDSAGDIMQRMQNMRVKGANHRLNVSALRPPASVLSRLLLGAHDDTIDKLSQAPDLSSASQGFLSDVGLLEWDELSSATLAPIVASLLHQGLDSEALSLISRASERDEDAALLHQQAIIACHNGDVEVAIQAFDKVAAAIYTDDSSLAVLSQIANAADCDTRSAYYRSAVLLLETQQADAAVSAVCLRAINAFQSEEGDVNIDEIPSWLKDLWYKAFRNFATVGAYDDAYTTMLSIPSRSLRLDALRHLVAVMCEEGAAGILLRYAFVGMQEDLENCLSFRARNAYPLAQPDYYKLLYAWQCLMNNYRGAAATMYQRAKRLASLPLESGLAFDILTTQCQSYLIAINALELQAADKQWILIGAEGTQQLQKPRKRQRLMDAKMQDPAQITIEAIRKEYTLTLARLQLSRDFPELAGNGQHLDSQGAVALFTQIGAFDSALQTALALGMDMSNIFEHMALRCVSYSQSGFVDEADAVWVNQDSSASNWEGSLASKAWKLLQFFLEKYDVDGEYRRKVLTVILTEDRRTRLPKSLVDWFMDNHTEFLIWKLVEYDLLEDAFVYSHRMLEQRYAQLQRNITNTRSSAVYIPYNLLDQLLAVDLEEEVVSRKEDLQDQKKKLREAVEQQYRRMNQILTIL